MLNSNQSQKEITNRCIHIMLKYHYMFPIVETIVEACSKYSEEQKPIMIQYEIEKYIGLSYIVYQKTNHVQEIWWTLYASNYTSVLNSVIKSILLIYMKPCIFPEDQEMFNDFLVQENLNV